MDKITESLIKDLKLEDLTESQQYIANEIGIGEFADICIKTGGGTFCFPNRKNLLKEPIKRRVEKEFNGSNIRELASKYEISQSTVYNYVR